VLESRRGATRECHVLKTAQELVNEIGLSVQPPRGIALVLTEEPGTQPNWVAAAGPMENALTDKFSEKVAELRKTASIGAKWIKAKTSFAASSNLTSKRRSDDAGSFPRVRLAPKAD
jgi:hypothetical protein